MRREAAAWDQLPFALDAAEQARIRDERSGKIAHWGDEKDIVIMERYLKVHVLSYEPMAPLTRCKRWCWEADPADPRSPAPSRYMFLRFDSESMHYELYVDGHHLRKAIFDRLELSVDVERAYGRGHPLGERTIFDFLPEQLLRDAGVELRGEEMRAFGMREREGNWGALPEAELDAKVRAFWLEKMTLPPAPADDGGDSDA